MSCQEEKSSSYTTQILWLGTGAKSISLLNIKGYEQDIGISQLFLKTTSYYSSLVWEVMLFYSSILLQSAKQLY